MHAGIYSKSGQCGLQQWAVSMSLHAEARLTGTVKGWALAEWYCEGAGLGGSPQDRWCSLKSKHGAG